MSLQSARHIALEVFEKTLAPGDRAVDATMGRGRDTLALCRLVGEAGRVYAFDVQLAALLETRALLESEGMLCRASLYWMGHERMAERVPAGVKLVAFNLGWLPGSDKGLTTRVDTTLLAVQSALQLLSPGGVLSLCCYPGHPEGQRELDALTELAKSLAPQRFTALKHVFLNAGPGAPVAILIEKTKTPASARR